MSIQQLTKRVRCLEEQGADYLNCKDAGELSEEQLERIVRRDLEDSAVLDDETLERVARGGQRV